MHVKNVVLKRKKLSVKKLKERYLQLKTCGDLWFGVVEGRDGGLEGVNHYTSVHIINLKNQMNTV